MFIVELTYKVPLEQIDALMRPHVAFLKKYYASGNFLISGRQIPRTGGIIVAVAASREQIEAIMAKDPFSATDSPTCASSGFAPASGPTISPAESLSGPRWPRFERATFAIGGGVGQRPLRPAVDSSLAESVNSRAN